MLLYFIYFLNSQWEGEKASTYAFWHINSSQWRERGSQWFQIQNQDGLFWQAPNYRVLQAQIKRDNFGEILFSYSIPEDRVKPRKPQRPSTNWFGFSSHLGWARSQTTNHPSGLVLLASSLPSETEKASPPLDPSTWRKDRASSSRLLDKWARPELQNPLEDLEAVTVWQVWILQSILRGLSWQPFIALKHFILSCYHSLK